MTEPNNYAYIDSAARKISSFVNTRIEEECKGEHPLRWRSIAESICAEVINSETWEYMLREAFGRPPIIAITRYLPSTLCR